MCVPIVQEEPFEEQKGTCKMKQNLSFFRDISTDQKMCAIVGKSKSGNAESGGLPVRAPPSKTTASLCEA